MMVLRPITSLKDYVAHHPPGVTFFLCLVTLALSFTFLGVYIHGHILPNPDVVKDWNHLLSSMAQYHLCEKNTSFSQFVETATKEPKIQKEDILYSTTMDISFSPVHARVPLILSSNWKVNSQSITIHTSFSASQLQLEGNETYNATIDFAANENSACLTIKVPALLSTSLLPPACNLSVMNRQARYTEAKKVMSPAQKCYSLQAIYDPTLQVMMTKEDQLLVFWHLMEAALVLLGVCLILCLSASLTHSLYPHSYWKEQPLLNEALVNN